MGGFYRGTQFAELGFLGPQPKQFRTQQPLLFTHSITQHTMARQKRPLPESEREDDGPAKKKKVNQNAWKRRQAEQEEERLTQLLFGESTLSLVESDDTPAKVLS